MWLSYFFLMLASCTRMNSFTYLVRYIRGPGVKRLSENGSRTTTFLSSKRSYSQFISDNLDCFANKNIHCLDQTQRGYDKDYVGIISDSDGLILLQSSEFVIHCVVNRTLSSSNNEDSNNNSQKKSNDNDINEIKSTKTNYTIGSVVQFILDTLKRIKSESNYDNKNNDVNLDDDSLAIKVDRRSRDASYNYNATDLLALGSIWHLPVDAKNNKLSKPSKQPKNNNSNTANQKPHRVSVDDIDGILVEGDYLRVHHTPRRFLAAEAYDWSITLDKCEKVLHNGDKESVMIHVDGDLGYIIINKPEDIPVHPTVDNCIENVQSMIKKSLQKNLNAKEDLYVTTPHRLDHDTAGLLVVATKKSFASYFSKLLRQKTAHHQQLSYSFNNKYTDRFLQRVSKKYRCLVCIKPSASSISSDSMKAEVDRLLNYSTVNGDEDRVVVHYLEPSINAPKRFEPSPRNETWPECVLRISNVNKVYPVRGSPSADKLVSELWSGENSVIPESCVSVAEIEVELLTGRTHQIRGQMSAIGFPLVGDILYGGAETKNSSMITSYHDCERLALQNFELSFAKPMWNTTEESLYPSKDLNNFRLGQAWWSRALDDFELSSEGDETTSITDLEKVQLLNSLVLDGKSVSANSEVEHIPVTVDMEDGTHKYVSIKGIKGNKTLWFVRSSSPIKCGGPYHADVARELVEELSTKGYEVIVTGGGRIEFDESIPHAHIFGFSYGFGRGDHDQVARIIQESSGGKISASVNHDKRLY